MTSAFFSVIITTRDRPELFKLALESVLSQNFDDFNIIVVNDGSSEESLKQYHEIENEYQHRASFHYLVHRPNGHGHGYAMNYGVQVSLSNYLCFLDDDDVWIDPDHLSRAAKSIETSKTIVDLYYTNQQAYFSDGKRNTDQLWIEGIVDRIDSYPCDKFGSYSIDYHLLLTAKSFAHLNCSIFLRDLFLNVGGVDECIRYEEDRDLYIRSIDRAGKILYNPAYISRHHIPNKTDTNNLSTVLSGIDKKLYQLRVFDKGVLYAENPEIAHWCQHRKANELKNITHTLAGIGKYKQALFYAKQALGACFSAKWAAYVLYLATKRIFSEGRTTRK